ncbi:MAG: glycosyltransferase family 4 protein [Bacteroidota bacterium]
MKIAFIGTYPPRECGIGTFTENKFMAMVRNNGIGGEDNEGMVIAVSDHETSYDYPGEVAFTIRQNQQTDYIEAAAFINRSGADICILEHEFGIYGGQSGIYILPLLHRLEIPFMAVFHTVLKNPSYNERAILTEISKMAARTVVMSQKACAFLEDIYHIPREKIKVIAHGVPDLQFDQDASKKEFKLGNKSVLLTFGLIGRNKGIETVIKALPAVVARHPDVVYIVLGKTHPAVLRHSGEEYRIYLYQLIKKLQLEKHVLFMNEFVSQRKLIKYLSAADIYITPYLNEAQITSGTLSYAVGAGCAVISTPYWHAAELLAEGRGRLFDFNSHDELSSILLDLLGKDDIMETLRCNALSYGRETTWPRIGRKYLSLGKTMLDEQLLQSPKKEITLNPLILPPFSLEHVKRMTDDTGIIQHAKFGIPNLKEGYCLDDNARALLMVLMAFKQKKHPLTVELMPVYLSYIHYMQNEDGTFRNFLSFSRNFLDEVGSEDSFGRAIWALGYLLGNAPNDAYFQSGREIFFKAVPFFKKLQSLRGVANSIIGVSYYLQSNPADMGMAEELRGLADKLINCYNDHRTEGWKWFEPSLTYDNAVLPLSLLHAGSTLKDEAMLKVAMESMDFLSCLTLKSGCLSVIGNEQWYLKDGEPSLFAQQPIDAMGMVLMFQKAFRITKDKSYLDKLYASFMWFLGENDMRMSLYDYETKGCCDGLENYGVNRNQGAESTLAYLISHLTLLETFEDTYTPDKKDFPVQLADIPGSNYVAKSVKVF